MATKRRPIDRPARMEITPEMVALFARGVEIEEAGATEDWEKDGGRRREYLDTSNCGGLEAAGRV